MKRKRDRSESGQLRNKINRWVRFLSKERDWDYVFMLEMEYMKLRQMEEYFKEMDTFVGIEYARRDLRICLRLLDIVMERDVRMVGDPPRSAGHAISFCNNRLAVFMV